MRLSRQETMDLMNCIIEVRNGKKPGLLSSKVFKRVYNHSKFNELDNTLKEIKMMELSMKSQENFNNIMKKIAVLINTFLDKE